MSLFDKIQLTIALATELGADLEDRLEGERKAVSELTGAHQALKQASKKVPVDLVAVLEASLAKGEEIKDGMESVEVAQLVRKYLTRVGDYLSHLADVEQQKAVIEGGRVAGLEDAMKVIQRRRDDETLKLQRMVEAAKQIQNDEVVAGPRSSGEAARAEHGTAAERRAAEHGAVLETEPSAEPLTEQAEPVVAKPKKKRKARA